MMRVTVLDHRSKYYKLPHMTDSNNQQDVYIEYLSLVEYIKNSDIEGVKILLKSNRNLIHTLCPYSNHNLLGIAIIAESETNIIKTLINSGVLLNGSINSSLPLKALPILNPTAIQMDAAYEIILAGASYDFYDSEITLWLDTCKEYNQLLYERISQAIIERASLIGKFELCTTKLLLLYQHKDIFLQAIEAADQKNLELKMLYTKKISEAALLENSYCSIRVHIQNYTGSINFSIDYTTRVNIEKNLYNIFSQSKKKLALAKKTFKTTDDIEEATEAQTTILCYYANGWAGAKLDTDLLEIIANNPVILRKPTTINRHRKYL